MKEKKKTSLWILLIVAVIVIFFGYMVLRMLGIALRANLQHSLRSRVRNVMVVQDNIHMIYFSNITSFASLKLPCRAKIYDIDNSCKKIVFNVYIFPTPKIKFIFSPVTPSGRDLTATINKSNKIRKCFWAFSIPSWFNPELFVVFNDFSRKILSDNEISWYYQCLLKELTSEELEKEKEYRKKKGLSELKK